MKTKILAVLIICIALFQIDNTVNAETYVDKDTFFHSSNVSFNTTKDLLFTNVSVHTDHVTFNLTSFYIFPANHTNVSLHYLAPDISAVTTGENATSFYTNDSSGLIYINISSFNTSTVYSVFMNGTFQYDVTSTASGYVNFTDNVTEQYIQIRLGTGATVPTPPGGGGYPPKPDTEEPIPEPEPKDEYNILFDSKLPIFLLMGFLLIILCAALGKRRTTQLKLPLIFVDKEEKKKSKKPSLDARADRMEKKKRQRKKKRDNLKR